MRSLFTLCLLALAAAQDKRYVFFGKFKWGQDNDYIYLTVYCPGLTVDAAQISITSESFSFEGSVGDKTADIEFTFREDVVHDDVTIEHWPWLSGRQADSIFFQIPKAMPHYFDRLTVAPYTREFKKTFEIDWNRYKRDENEEELNADEPDEEEWLDDDEVMFRKHIKVLTDETFNKTINKKDLVVVHATYPWCPHCRDYLPFLEAVKLKKLRKKAVFASVDARENRQLARLLNVTCEKPLVGQKSVDITGCNRSLFVYKAGQSLGTYDSKHNDTDADRLVRYLQAMAGPFPKPVKKLSDLEKLKKEYEQTTVIPVGLFDPSKEPDEFSFYTKYAEERRADGRLFAIVDVRNLTDGLFPLLQAVLPDFAAQLTTPAILLIKNYASDADEEMPHVFAGGLRDEIDEWTEDSISDFLTKFKHRLLAHYGKERLGTNGELRMGEKTLNQRGLPVVHLWLDTKIGNELLMTRVRQAAMHLSRRLAFVYHDQAGEEETAEDQVVSAGVSELYATELLGYGLDGKKRPVLGLEARGAPPFNHRLRYAMADPLDESTLASEIIQWCEDVLDGKVSQAVRSQPDQGLAAAGFAQQIVATTFKEQVMDSSHGVFINMFNYNSGVYKAHTPELKKLAAALHTAGSNIRVLQYDYNKNEMDPAAKELEMIKRFTPIGTSLNFYLPGNEGGKIVHRMHSCDQGDCTAKAMAQFISTNLPSTEILDLEATTTELTKLDQFTAPSYKSACGRGQESCDDGYTCEFTICYKTDLSYDLSEPLKDSLSPEEEELESAKEL